MNQLRLLSYTYQISRVLCQKQVSKAGTSNYLPQIQWDVMICPCPGYLILAQHSSHMNWIRFVHLWCTLRKWLRGSLIMSSAISPPSWSRDMGWRNMCFRSWRSRHVAVVSPTEQIAIHLQVVCDQLNSTIRGVTMQLPLRGHLNNLFACVCACAGALRADILANWMASLWFSGIPRWISAAQRNNHKIWQ